MTNTTTTDLSYDPYDRDIDADPYPVYRRLREEAPLYYNEPYDFYAVSRFDDVQRGLVDRETYSSARGSVLEFIKADIEMPPGVDIFEDPPQHTAHRGLLSRVFTPKRMNALEPKVRFEPPTPHVARYVAREVELYGTTVPAGSALICLSGSANRDDRHYADADRFDIHREIGQHLTFGYGIHYCLGAALARLEGRVALDEVLTRFPEWDVDWDNVMRAPTSTVRGWESLPVFTT